MSVKIINPGGAEGDRFGTSVAIEGSTLAVGAWLQQVDGNNWQGAVHVYSLTEAGWVKQTELVASDGDIGDALGYSVSISGATILSGAYCDDIEDDDQGSAYFFSPSGIFMPLVIRAD